MISDRQNRFFPGQAALDRAVLSRLFDLAGPGTAPELMRRLIGDLAGVRDGLQEGLAQDDMGVLRKHGHVLVAITGTIGATQVYELASALNHQARSGDLEGARARAALLLASIAGLLAHLKGWAAELGMGL